MIAHQYDAAANKEKPPSQEASESIRQGADILRAALRFDEQIMRNVGKLAAISDFRSLRKPMAPLIFQALGEVEREASRNVVRSCPAESLAAGMVLNEGVRTQNGLLIVARGQEVTFPLIVKLKNLFEKNAIRGNVSEAVSKAMASAAGAG